MEEGKKESCCTKPIKIVDCYGCECYTYKWCWYLCCCCSCYYKNVENKTSSH